ncbi:DUF2441 domain-containing protein [Acinetobacter sp. TUM15113]|uniref:DUF2441 domain-containing protein n=1 Tax=Acinetobacter sp. TUM15113 TaxID=2609140 RepID=UPI00124F58C9|nr:DUF2441 domain-containing protein [Acinetobacter sp. TUM15113]
MITFNGGFMTTYFTVDRINRVNEGDVFSLITDFSATHCFEFEGFFTHEDNYNLIGEYYPNGISRHGQSYLCGYPSFAKKTKNNQFVPKDDVIEAIFELVRRLEFPELPSRMSSMFAWQSLNDALAFANSNHIGGFKIHEVETESENIFIGDMNFLKTGGQVINSYVLARKYWSGETSSSPILEVLIPLPVTIGKEVEI